jgi:transcriptional regulator with XRE-family HTH domain
MENKDLKKIIGENIRILRLIKKIKTDSLSSYVGISPNQLYKYETGKDRVPVEKLYMFSKMFNKTIDSFFESIEI